MDVLEPLGWLTDLDLVYWGDIDTHGFAILNRLRHRFGNARSMLMDRTICADQQNASRTWWMDRRTSKNW